DRLRLVAVLILEGQNAAAVRIDEDFPIPRFALAPEAERPHEVMPVTLSDGAREGAAGLVLRRREGDDLEMRLRPERVPQGAPPTRAPPRGSARRRRRSRPRAPARR